MPQPSSPSTTVQSAEQPSNPPPEQPTLAYIGLGSNLGDRVGYLSRALEAIAAEIGPVVATSGVYEAEPWGISLTPCPSFLNSVVAVRTAIGPEATLTRLLAIEDRLGRTRTTPNAPRTIDLDLLAYGSERRDSHKLQLPHPRIAQRRFILRPWCDIAPEFAVPGLDTTVAELLLACDDELLVEPFVAIDADSQA